MNGGTAEQSEPVNRNVAKPPLQYNQKSNQKQLGRASNSDRAKSNSVFNQRSAINEHSLGRNPSRFKNDNSNAFKTDASGMFDGSVFGGLSWTGPSAPSAPETSEKSSGFLSGGSTFASSRDDYASNNFGNSRADTYASNRKSTYCESMTTSAGETLGSRERQPSINEEESSNLRGKYGSGREGGQRGGGRRNRDRDRDRSNQESSSAQQTRFPLSSCDPDNEWND